MSLTIDTRDYEGVSLAETVAEAELLTRVDRKYLVPAAEARRIIAACTANARVLDIDGRRCFSYDSMYFDTPSHLSYRLTAQRRRRRFKIRTRSYVDTGDTFLEVKTKSGRGSTVKERVAYDTTARGTLTSEGRDYLSRVLTSHGHDASLVSALRPSLISQYKRVTLIMSDGSRATVDEKLRWHDTADTTILLRDHVIIESKSPGSPSQLDRALWRAGQRPSGISKFGTGTAALHPALPSNKWARTLAGPFQTSIVTI